MIRTAREEGQDCVCESSFRAGEAGDKSRRGPGLSTVVFGHQLGDEVKRHQKYVGTGLS